MQKEPDEGSADVSQRGHFDMISPPSNGSSLNAIKAERRGCAFDVVRLWKIENN
jgi:hypothetical protein